MRSSSLLRKGIKNAQYQLAEFAQDSSACFRVQLFGGFAMSRNAFFCTLAIVVVSFAAFFLYGCSSAAPKSSSPATVNVTVSDPATCSAPQRAFSHIYVTI